MPLRVMYLNAQSLFNKINELNVTVAEEAPDLIFISETWCGPHITNAELTVAGYQLESELRRDRADTTAGIGGGLLVYSKIGTVLRPTNRFKEINFNQFIEFELVAESPVNFVILYRPPNSGQDNVLELCKILRDLKKETIVVGDFNLPEINWDAEQSGARGRPVLEAAQDQQLVQLIDFATHTKGNTLDLLLVNCPERILTVEAAGRLGKSDHETIMFEVLIKKFNRKNHCSDRLNWKKSNYDAMKEFLYDYNWAMDAESEINCDWTEFKTVMAKLVELFIPAARIRSQNRPKWITNEIIRLIRKKKRAWKLAKNYNTGEHVDYYKKLEKEVSNKIRNAKRKLERNLAFGEDKKRKKFSNYVKEKTKTKTSIGPLRSETGETTADKNAMANILNNFFASVFTNEDKNNMPAKNAETESVLRTVSFTPLEVIRKLNNLRADSAPGPDKIYPRMLKELRYEIADPLSKIFTKSMKTGKVPKNWKEAIVTPIHKKGPKAEPGNYRPVSLTSVPCKVMESIIKDAIMTHLQANDLISHSQHGFVPGRSCATNLLTFQEELTKCLDEGIPVDVFYLDFAKAFDKVPHGRLIIKLEAKGITGELLNWVEEWLAGRTQRVAVEGVLSEEEEVKSGVPQGTVMGPPLFTVFIDDIDEFVELVKLFVKFADDGKGLKIIQSRKDADELQLSLNNLCEWASRWGMAFNVDKCKIMHIGRNNPGYDYYMNGVKLKVVEQETDVGVIIQKDLKTVKQSQKAANTATGVLKTIQRNFHFRDKKVYVQLYKQYVRPHLEFACTAWSPWLENEKKQIESVQVKAVNWITGLQGTNYMEKCVEIGLSTLESRRWEQDMVQTYKILNGHGNLKYETFFEKVADRGTIRTRGAAGHDNLLMPRFRTEIRRHVFSIRVIRSWNDLPDSVKQAGSVAAFKNGLKTYIENGGRPGYHQ
jgi:hypothetical protein